MTDLTVTDTRIDLVTVRFGSALASVLLGLVLLTSATYAAEATKPAEQDNPHAQVYDASAFPSASKCATCHQQIYDEWSSSSHAYSAISPMFHKFEQKINDLAPTISNFCVRCHMSVGTTLGEKRDAPLWERSQISREGVTCITCHRVNEQFTKVNGDRRIEPGDIHQPMYGPIGGDGVAEVVNNKGEYKVATSAAERGAKIHTTGIKFEQLKKSEFCVSCHQVAVNIGIKLEVVWDQYRNSPAFEQGVTCQDCHMGKVPGVAAGYDRGPAAKLQGKSPNVDRQHSNHAFYGPGYPIAHPGIFPHNPVAERWSVEEWLKFDYRAGWGTEAFENKIDAKELKVEFPDVWEDAGDRAEAREIIAQNLEKVAGKAKLRRQVLENGSRLDGPFFASKPQAGDSLSFHYTLTNTNIGHNLPSGSLGAQPEIWLNVALVDPDGKNVWESGYVDKNGDMADLHSLEVAAGTIAHDDQLFNLQTKFLTTNVKGTDREMYLPVNVDVDQLPFLRPPAQPVSVMNHPPFVRMEGRSLPPLASRDAKYSVPGELLTKPGKYKLQARMRSRAEPIYFMRFVNATADMEQSMNEWMLDIHQYAVEFDIPAR